MKYKLNNKGFSLIEIAIAVVVIGLIASFSLKGKKLIDSAKLRTVVEQVDMFRMASQTFVEKYGAFPGDLTNAKEMISDNVTNGNGSGKINSLSDAKNFWAHLVAAELINSELNSEGLPTSKMGGCYTVSSNIDSQSGFWIILCQHTTDNKNFDGIISPEDAYIIDKNNDTGKPTTGEIRAIKSQSGGECIVNSQYNFKNKNKDCVLLFRLW